MNKNITGKVKPIDQTIGLNILYFRHLKGETLSSLAKKIGVSHQQLKKYETSTNRISAGVLYELAKALDENVERFFVLKEQVLPIKALRKMAKTDPEMKKLLGNFKIKNVIHPITGEVEEKMEELQWTI